MQIPFSTLSLDKELLLSDGQTNTSDGPGKVGGVDKILPVVPGRAYIATVNVTSIDEVDTDEVYQLTIQEIDADGVTPKRKHNFTANSIISAAGVFQLGFVPLDPNVTLVLEMTGTTPSIVIAKAYVSGVKN